MKAENGYGKDMDFKIEIDLEKSCGLCDGYHYVVLAWFVPNDLSKTPFWHNTGINGEAETPLKAFSEGFSRFQESMGLSQ